MSSEPNSQRTPGLEALEAFARVTGCDDDFFKNLRQEEDWLFIVKLSAYIEAVTHEGLMRELDINNPSIEKRLERMGQSQRLDWLQDLQVITKGLKVPLKQIAEIRNAFVHKTKNLGAKLSNYFDDEDLSPNDCRDIRDNMVLITIELVIALEERTREHIRRTKEFRDAYSKLMAQKHGNPHLAGLATGLFGPYHRSERR